jgi:hypothetical protein
MSIWAATEAARERARVMKRILDGVESMVECFFVLFSREEAVVVEKLLFDGDGGVFGGW